MDFSLTKIEAVELFGSQRKLAEALGISEQAVSNWKDGPIPKARALQIRYELRPDHFAAAQQAS